MTAASGLMQSREVFGQRGDFLVGQFGGCRPHHLIRIVGAIAGAKSFQLSGYIVGLLLVLVFYLMRGSVAMSSNSPVPDEKKLERLAEHYQKTFEMNYQTWRDRNNYFLTLVAVLAGATLLFSLGKSDASSIIVIWIGNLIGLKESQPNPFASSANFELLQLLVLAVIFCLTLKGSIH